METTIILGVAERYNDLKERVLDFGYKLDLGSIGSFGTD
jgi:hypothetical protein